jgi:hypothetical protein
MPLLRAVISIFKQLSRQDLIRIIISSGTHQGLTRSMAIIGLIGKLPDMMPIVSIQIIAKTHSLKMPEAHIYFSQTSTYRLLHLVSMQE